MRTYASSCLTKLSFWLASVCMHAYVCVYRKKGHGCLICLLKESLWHALSYPGPPCSWWSFLGEACLVGQWQNTAGTVWRSGIHLGCWENDACVDIWRRSKQRISRKGHWECNIVAMNHSMPSGSLGLFLCQNKCSVKRFLEARNEWSAVVLRQETPIFPLSL